MSAPVVYGVFLGYSAQRGALVYEYHCPDCGRKFRETTPDVSAPSLCHACFVGSSPYLRWAMRDKWKRRKK